MLWYIRIDGITVPVQKCTRKDGTEYWRLAPNFYRPTPNQMAVRRTVALSAWQQKERDGYTTRERVNEAVQNGFAGWIPSEAKRETKLNLRIKHIKNLANRVRREENAEIAENEIR
jgi:hypothetical protein